jgi:hypothetical protein
MGMKRKPSAASKPATIDFTSVTVGDSLSALGSLVGEGPYMRAIAYQVSLRVSAEIKQRMTLGLLKAADQISDATEVTAWRKFVDGKTVADVLYAPMTGFDDKQRAQMVGMSPGKSLNFDAEKITLELLGVCDKVG